MKIKRILLFNIGPYVNLNAFDFSCNTDKNIALIGGKNGAGKTTFFKAIKTCLYGCRVWGFDAPGKEYLSIINGLVNFKSLYDATAKAYIEIELMFDDGKQVNTYVLHREWKKNKTLLTEFFHITKNGELIIGSEEDDFTNYLLSIIPPDMFNFYFFDGESIADFFLDSEGNKNFRNAFLKLYGLDTLSIMVENFSRNIKHSSGKSISLTEFSRIRNERESESEKYKNLLHEIRTIEEKIDLLQIKIQSLKASYSKDGGVGLAEWKELNAMILAEEALRDKINKWLKDCANHLLPFVLLDKELLDLQKTLLLEQENIKTKLMGEAISTHEFLRAIEVFLNDNAVTTLTPNDLVNFLSSELATSETDPLFDFSINQINKLLDQISEKLDFNKVEIKKQLTLYNSSLNKTKKLRERLLSSSIEGYATFVEEKERFEEEIDSLQRELGIKTVELEKQTVNLEHSEQAYAKAKSTYEESLKCKSINDLSERAAAVYTLLEEKLVKRQAKILQDEFVRCFHSIINKDGFIDGIIIDKNINIIPYKYVNLKFNQLENYKKANKDFIYQFDSTRLLMDINSLEMGTRDEIQVPSPIKSPFSQGERQVYIMSIYLALLKTSKKDIPFFIDTPFARIDSNHRSNIVKEFFLSIKNQLFILSTDEEIVGTYKKMLNKRISNLYKLDISSYGTTKIIANKYFEE